MSKQIIHTDAAPAAVGPYSQAVAASGTKTVYLSGQIGLEPGTGDLVSENFDARCARRSPTCRKSSPPRAARWTTSSS